MTSVDLIPPTRSAEITRPKKNRTDDSDENACGAEPHSLQHDEAKNIAALGTHGHADTNLRGALPHRGGDDAVEANAGEQTQQ